MVVVVQLLRLVDIVVHECILNVGIYGASSLRTSEVSGDERFQRQDTQTSCQLLTATTTTIKVQVVENFVHVLCSVRTTVQ